MLEKAFDSIAPATIKAEMTMTPLIDMVFLLLIFFVVTTTFTKETGIKVAKARAATSQIINRNLLIIAVDDKGHYWYDKSRRPLDEIVATVAAAYGENNELNIVIVPDKNGRVEPLIALMDRLRNRGISSFSLGTQAVVEK
ncbi:MAG: biopolymer transporter ExbD [Chitinispirillaceae bacterium]|nr:biopolymer transporter ExbD [Chitinispirillaceae bacterium]